MSLAREKARDSRRLSSMRQIINAMELYNTTYGIYPVSDDDSADPLCPPVLVPIGAPTGSIGFDCSNVGTFMNALVPFMNSDIPVDPLNNANFLFGYYKGTTGLTPSCPNNGTVRAVLLIGQFEGGDGRYENPDPCNMGSAHWVTVFAE